MIKVENVTMEYPVPKRYREMLLTPFKKNKRITALKNIHLEIKRGGSVAFLGPNGAGKTSLLKLIGGLLLPTQGSGSVNGEDTMKHNARARQSVGYVINEERSFYWRLTGMQNLEFFGALDNLSGKMLKERIGVLLDLVGLTDAAHKQVGAYSSGMKQKLAIARGLLAEPDILILDEPTRTLDPIASEELCDFIVNDLYARLHKTLLIATHNLDIVPDLCTSVCLINNRQIVCYDTVERVLLESTSLIDFYIKKIDLR
jgi:ABC-2 type transport system ATP-binding protein